MRNIFIRKQFRLLTIASAAIYLLSSFTPVYFNLLAGNLFGEDAISAINLILPVFNIVMFLSGVVSFGAGISYSEA